MQIWRREYVLEVLHVEFGDEIILQKIVERLVIILCNYVFNYSNFYFHLFISNSFILCNRTILLIEYDKIFISISY